MIPRDVQLILTRTCEKIARFRGNRFEQFDAIRTAMMQFTTVDAFYVAEFVGDNTIHFHHQYDGDFFDIPGTLSVRRGGTAHWVRVHRRSYLYVSDNGNLLNAGVRFGQVDKASLDAIVTPVFDSTPKRGVMGLVSIQSYTPKVYSRSVVDALEHLAEALGVQATYEARMARRIPQLSVGVTSGHSTDSAEEVLHEVLGSLHELQKKIDKLRTQDDNTGSQVNQDLRILRREVERLQSNLWARELHQRHIIAARLGELTPRQRKLAELLALYPIEKIPSTAQLASEMGVTEATIKTHMNAVLRAFGASTKIEVCTAVRRLIKRSTQ
ncbi:hypothetical protein [Amycolatopsis japonica]|uniref:hypothetical protein n=1 Tax=Amycolatopsis japonica TaxID=208439 RepID=UPI003405CAD5